jgi:hypothetical protein
VSNVEPILEAENVTLEWPRPEGRVDRYHIKWYPLSNPEDVREKEVAGILDVEGVAGRKVSVLIGELHPGVEYMFEITNEANSLRYFEFEVLVRLVFPFLFALRITNHSKLSKSFTNNCDFT